MNRLTEWAKVNGCWNFCGSNTKAGRYYSLPRTLSAFLCLSLHVCVCGKHLSAWMGNMAHACIKPEHEVNTCIFRGTYVKRRHNLRFYHTIHIQIYRYIQFDSIWPVWNFHLETFESASISVPNKLRIRFY